MGERSSHAAGTFSWTDLATPDPEAAKRFYGELFGWEFDDQPMPGDAGDYSMGMKDGGVVAALYRAREDQPPAWASYVTVESADSTATKAGEVGGTLFGEPFDVMDAGRMALIQDPSGAFF